MPTAAQALLQQGLAVHAGFQSGAPREAGAQPRRWTIGDFGAAYAAGAVTPSQVCTQAVAELLLGTPVSLTIAGCG